VLSYQTLWLKCHYPAEFMAAILSNQPMGYYPPRVLVAEARRSGVTVLPPDVNASLDHYTVESSSIRVGLSQVKGITGEAVACIISEQKKDKFSSLRDFVLRVEASLPIFENLVKVGALDALGNRGDMLQELPDLLQFKRRNVSGKLELLGDILPEVVRETERSKYDKRESLIAERELLSLDLSAHPLDFCNLGNGFTQVKELPSLKTGQSVKIAGSVIRYQTPPTRSGKRVVYIIMEDGTGVADVTVFHDVQERCGKYLFRSGWLEVRGKIQRRGPKSLSIIANEVIPLRQRTITIR
jgi:error-prone DNA polymerase